MLKVNKGRFIVIEGMDGSGKSTLHKSLVKELESQGVDVVAIRDPGGTPTADYLRVLLKEGSEGKTLEPMSELLGFYTARNELYHKVIVPALEANKVVISDRWILSTEAYQGMGLGFIHECRVLKRLLELPDPDLTLILDMDWNAGLARAHSRCSKGDVIESRNEDYWKRVAFEYSTANSTSSSHEVKRIDATRTPEEVLSDALKVIGV